MTKDTDFWKKHTAQDTEHEERPKGIVGEWYTLTSDFDGRNETEDRKAGYTWECEEVDEEGEPMIDGLVIGIGESYRKATPKDIRREMAERIKTYRQNKQRPSEHYDYINPDHYKQGSKEVIEMMVDIWGAEAVALHCEMCAFKYRMRLGNKPDQPIERDLEKARWYENKAKELR